MSGDSSDVHRLVAPTLCSMVPCRFVMIKWTTTYLHVDSDLPLRRDMAQLVDHQGIKVNEIAKSTDASHDRAKAGLQQVNRAAESQPVCSLC